MRLHEQSAQGGSDALARDDDALFCSACGRLATRARWAVARGGTHDHTFTNPLGITFRVRCFSEAPGTARHGPAVTRDTWFPGFAWTVVICRGCAQHMGWLYTAPASAFFGLIGGHLSVRGSG